MASNFIVRGGADFSSIIRAFSNLGKSMNQTQTKLKSATEKTGKAIEKSVKSSVSKFDGLKAGITKIAKVVGLTAIAAKFTSIAKEGTEMAMTVESAMDNIERNMSGASQAFKNWVETQSKSLGMAKADAYEYGATFSNLLSSFMSSTQETANKTQELMKAAAIIASKTGRTYDDVANRIRSGMLGSTEAIEDLGVYTNISMIESTEAFKKFAGNKSWSQLDFQTQQQIRLAAILEQTYARYGDTLADTTQTRQAQFIASLKNIQLNIGQAFLPIYNAVLPALTELANKIEAITATIAAFIQAIFGSNNAQVQVAQASNAATKAQTEHGKAIEKAGKKVKSALSGFDQLNTLTQEMAVSISDSTDEIADSGSLNFETGNADLAMKMDIDTSAVEAATEKIRQIKTVIQEIGQWLRETLGPAFQEVWAAISPQLELWKDTFRNVFSQFGELAAPLKDYFVNTLLPAWADGIKQMGEILAGIIDTGRQVFQGLIYAVLPLIQAFVTQGLPFMTSFASGVFSVFKSLFEVVKTIFDAIWRDAVQPAMKLVADIIADVLTSIKSFWDKWGQKIADGLKQWFDWMKTTFTNFWENFLGPIVQKSLEMLRWLWENHLKGIVDEVLEFVGRITDGFLNIMNKVIMPFVNWLIQFVGPSVSNFVQLVIDVFGTLFAVIADIIKDLIHIINGIVDFLVGVFTLDWEKAWNGIKDIFIGIWHIIADSFKGVINLLIDVINWFIRGINKISIKVPDWVAGLLGMPKGSVWGFNIKEIPKLATGGLAYGPTLAVVGDNPRAISDPEVISPLSKLQDIMGGSNQAVVEVLNRILRVIESNSGDIVLKMNENELGRATIKALNAYQRSTGKSLVLLLNL